jgi:putative ABC transport system permease protein
MSPSRRHDRPVEPARWRRYLRFWGPDPRADVADELAFHLESLVEENVATGMEPAAARRAALARFGDRARYEDQCRELGERRVRRMRRIEQLDSLRHDLALATRSLRGSPGFALATVLVLALGIGANLAVFSVVSGVLLEPLPFREPERLVRLFELFPVRGDFGEGSVSHPNYLDWKRQSASFAGMAVAGWRDSVVWQSAGGSEPLSVMPVGADYFALLGVRPLLGRVLGAADVDPANEPAVVLGEGAWRARLGGDTDVLGRRLVLDGTPHVVIGVMPDAFSRTTDGWVPLRVPADLAASRGSHAFQVLARLAPGVTVEAAQQELARIAAQIAAAHPDQQEGRSALVRPLRDTYVGRVEQRLLALFGGATLVLFVACANAAGLLVARGMARRRDIAVQAALGATRWRVVRQLLVESVLLAAAGTVLGLGLTWSALRALAATGDLLPRASEIALDARVAAFAALVALATGVLFGLAPALRTSRVDLQQDLRRGARQSGGGSGAATRLRGALVVVQLALSLMLLVGAGLLMRAFTNLSATETGMQLRPALSAQVLRAPKANEDPIAAFQEPLLERLRAVPGVQAAGMISHLPLVEWGTNGNFGIVGESYPSIAETPWAEYRAVTSGYFDAVGVPVLRGRDVGPRDRADGAPVVLVNRVLAERYFAGEEAVGRQLDLGDTQPTIAGVVGDVRQATLEEEPRPEIYVPYAQALGAVDARRFALVVRTAGDPALAASAVRRAVAETDPAAAVLDLRPMRDVVAGSIADRRFYLAVLAAFAVVALALAVAGLYAVVAYAVQQRRQELGIRLALGCSDRGVQGLVVRDGAKLALLGLALGLPASYLGTRALESLLYGVARGDTLTYVLVAVTLAGAALAASWLPARRATRQGAVLALRAE